MPLYMVNATSVANGKGKIKALRRRDGRMEGNMDEYYQLIEQTIKDGGYPGPIDGSALYNEISDEIDGKEPGTYVFFTNQGENLIFEYKVDVMEEEFNLSYLRITDNGQEYYINFD